MKRKFHDKAWELLAGDGDVAAETIVLEVLHGMQMFSSLFR
jgi:hypothetical protein